MYIRTKLIALVLSRAAIIAAVCLVTAAYLMLLMPTPGVSAAGDAEDQEEGPRLFLPLVADDQDADDMAQSQQDAASRDTSVQAATAAEESEVSEATAEAGQTLFLSFIANDPDVSEQTGEDLAVDLTLFGGPFVGHEAVTADDDILSIVGASSGTSYYVDCNGGNDANSGTSTSAAWKSMSKANAAPLVAGDRLLFKRGCSWVGPLNASWRGSATSRIVIGAYGSGELPIIRDSYLINVQISGKFLVVENLHTTLSSPPNPDPNCLNQPRGHKYGFGFTSDASDNILRKSRATKLSIGIFFSYTSHDNQVLYNTITDNNVVWELTATKTSGATGILLHGDNHEIGRNYFARNRPACTYTGGLGGISIELYGASHSNIHHNIAQGDRVFSELGSSTAYMARNNTFAYNLHVSGYSANNYGARFVVTRGYGHQHGPVLGTKVYNNVIYFTGNGGKAVTCEQCGTDILTLKNNILWATEPFWSNVPFIEASNIFWDNDGVPFLKWNGATMNAGSRIASPQFVNAPNGDFHLRSSSPAVNKAAVDALATTYRRDLDENYVPVANIADIGSFEFGSSANP